MQIILVVLISIAVRLIVACCVAVAVVPLWNDAVVAVFGLPALTWSHAVQLCLLVSFMAPGEYKISSGES